MEEDLVVNREIAAVHRDELVACCQFLKGREPDLIEAITVDVFGNRDSFKVVWVGVAKVCNLSCCDRPVSILDSDVGNAIGAADVGDTIR